MVRPLAPAVPIELRVPSPLDELRDGRLARAGLRLFLKRDDLISPAIPGNKWRKLKHNLRAARDHGYGVLLTFGGAYSSHIRATAAAGHHYGFATIGIIRGEEHRPLNPVLSAAAGYGMRLEYLGRAAYRDKDNPELIASLHRRFGGFCLLPEGGSNALAAQGCAEIPAEITQPFDVVCVPPGQMGCGRVSMTVWQPRKARRCAGPARRWRISWPGSLMGSDARMRTG